MIDQFLPICRMNRSAEDFLFDPKSLEGSTRHFWPKYLTWAGIPVSIIPFEHVFIHAGIETPARIQERVNLETGQKQHFLFIQNELYISLAAVRMALAHECTHLFLVRQGHQHFFTKQEIERLRKEAAEAPVDYSLGFARVVRTSHPSSIMSPQEERNTDVASYALGFGKLVLNGVCEYAQKQQHSTLGLLGIGEHVYVYRRINELVGVPESVALKDLLPEAMREYECG